MFAIGMAALGSRSTRYGSKPASSMAGLSLIRPRLSPERFDCALGGAEPRVQPRPLARYFLNRAPIVAGHTLGDRRLHLRA